MSEDKNKDNNTLRKSDRLSIRTSVFVWLGGAVLGWVVAVIAIYTLLRAPESTIAEAPKANPAIEEALSRPDITDPEALSEIAPAAGGNEDSPVTMQPAE